MNLCVSLNYLKDQNKASIPKNNDNTDPFTS